MSYTKGEWLIRKPTPCCPSWRVQIKDDKEIAFCPPGNDMSAEANANLIAAAPETAECLMVSTKVLEDILRGYIGITPRGLIEQAVLNNKQALAKVEGGVIQ